MHPLKAAVTGFRWIRTMAALLRDLKTSEQHILSARDLLAREIRQNARVADGFHNKSWHIQGVQGQLHDERWTQYAAEWSVIRKKHPNLWNEVADLYENLGATRRQGLAPPRPEPMEDLAARLEQAEP